MAPERRARAAPGSGRAGGGKGRRAPTRAEQRHATRTRRNRLMLGGAAVLSALVLAAWFPASDLYHQHEELAAATARLAAVRGQDHALQAAIQRSGERGDDATRAQSQFQLARPGQQVYEVLPPNSAGGPTTYAGDPGRQGPVAPADATGNAAATGQAPTAVGSSDASAGAQGGSTSGGRAPTATRDRTRTSNARATHAASPGLWTRIVGTIEFWH